MGSDESLKSKRILKAGAIYSNENEGSIDKIVKKSQTSKSRSKSGKKMVPGKTIDFKKVSYAKTKDRETDQTHRPRPRLRSSRCLEE
jgi:hypothetical protein